MNWTFQKNLQRNLQRNLSKALASWSQENGKQALEHHLKFKSENNIEDWDWLSSWRPFQTYEW